jgi:hypothetical protein
MDYPDNGAECVRKVVAVLEKKTCFHVEKGRCGDFYKFVYNTEYSLSEEAMQYSYQKSYHYYKQFTGA